MPIQLIAFASILLAGCAGPAFYKIKNETRSPLVYSSLDEFWYPTGERFPISPYTEEVVPYSPNFELSSQFEEEKKEYLFEHGRSIISLFDIKWNEIKYLPVVINSGHEIFLQDEEQSHPFPLKPLKQNQAGDDNSE